MPDKQRVERFIDAVVHGDHVEAIRDFYHEDATMQENLGEPRRGRDTLMAHEAKALSNMQKMETKPVATFLVDGDNVAIRWTFIMTDKAGTRRQLEEVSLQRWDGDRIASEQFYYDSKTAWQMMDD
ncbi:hypothetical protein NBRC116588_20050 [Pyruvatibacter sp. HU-CL02332]|uniref:nuclear transport factor 2 family protein n=1 Tax=Pyruvatibacter sp. HU-CL02332 TaxID=3127650 RepID=UPI0031052C39